jgi:hypothetical protein
MLQYLLNVSAIWLISLFVFDIFLRKETYHGYNRAYLLFTFLLGIVVPLWQWQHNSPIYNTSLQHPVERIIAARQNIVDASAPSFTLKWEQILAVIYILGAFAALCLVLADIWKLIVFSKGGRRTQQGNWTIIETWKEHAPFSFRHILFVSSIKQYSDEEWRMILTHEQRHTTLLHFADLLLMQAARIVFWFHPLVYIYNKRLLLVHEYQADSASATQPHVYGQFLVEQALLQTAPSLSHSFNRSPIKKRIVMLTRRSTAVSRIKMFVFIPLALVCIVCFSKSSFSQKFERKGNIVTYRGNTFEYGQNPQIDTQILTDPVTNQETIKFVKHEPVPMKMNGIDIYGNQFHPDNIDMPAPYAKDGSVEDHILKGISKDLNKLTDGIYRIDLGNVVVDATGRIVYYEYGGITSQGHNNNIPKDIEKTIAGHIDDLLNSVPVMKPAKLNNKPVIANPGVFLRQYRIDVKDHRSTITKSWN